MIYENIEIIISLFFLDITDIFLFLLLLHNFQNSPVSRASHYMLYGVE